MRRLVVSALAVALSLSAAWSQIGPLPGMGPLPVPLRPITIWNTADKGANITLSNGNLDENATTSTSAWSSVRATNAQSAGKLHAEFLLVNVDGLAPGRFFFGLANSAFTLSNFLGSSSTSAGDQDGTGWTVSGMTIASNSVVSYNTVNTVIVLEADLTAGKIWTGKCSGGVVTWGSGGSPAAGTTPNITFTPPLALFPTASGFGDASPAKIRIRTNGATQSCAPSAGFTPWDG